MTSPTAHPVAADGRIDPCDAERGCITCGDVGVEMRVEAVGGDGLGSCTGPDGGREEVDLALLGAVAPGDAVLVHAGVALVLLDAGAAA